jgi:hypothetical protein
MLGLLLLGGLGYALFGGSDSGQKSTNRDFDECDQYDYPSHSSKRRKQISSYDCDETFHHVVNTNSCDCDCTNYCKHTGSKIRRNFYHTSSLYKPQIYKQIPKAFFVLKKLK